MSNQFGHLPKPFLTAEWRHLAMLNFEIDPKGLQPSVPAGTELDDWQGRFFVSIVGFLFLETRVLGIRIPFHRNFEEVNLRFYVRRKIGNEWRRGVVFVKEIVPRLAIAWGAKGLYGENYIAAPMWHRIERETNHPEQIRNISYSWKSAQHENSLELFLKEKAQEIASGSEEEFITEHYWGYTNRSGGKTMEYRVEHPRWKVAKASSSTFQCDVAGIYGDPFVDSLSVPPSSAFLAEGSEVSVFRGTSITG